MIEDKIKLLISKTALIKPETSNNYHVIDNWWSWIFDFRKAFLNPEILDIFSKYFWDKYWELYPFQVWWIESWAIPFVTWIAIEWLRRWKPINAFYIRKTRKEKWLWNMIEWNLWDEKIIIVDDVLNWWQSIYTIIKALYSINRNIFKAFVFVNFCNSNWQNIIRENNISLDYLFTLSDFWLQDYVDWWFWNDPIIYPKFKQIFRLNNENLFLDNPKSNPILFQNKLFLWWEWGDFFCINKDSWDIIWRRDLPKTFWHKNILSSPIIVDDNIIFWNYDGNLYFLDINSGDTKHIFETWADFIWSSPDYDYKNNILFIWLEHAWVNNKWSLIAFDCKNKKVLWENNFNDFVHCSPSFLESKNLVVCWWNDWKLICVNSNDWNIIFQLKFSSPIKGSFVFSECSEYVFFWTHDSCFYKVRLSDWEIISKVNTGNIIYTKPLLIDKEIFFWSLDKSFYHLNQENLKIKQAIKTFWKIFGEPILINSNIICFSSNSWYIYFYDYKTKKIVYKIFHWEKINNKLIYEKEQGFLFVVDHVGWVYKYNIKLIVN